MSERGISPQYHNGLNYNQLGDVASERKREWDGLTIRKLEKKKPYNFKTYQDMIYTYDRRDGKSPYPNSRKETVIPVGSFQAQRASFDGLDPSPLISEEWELGPEQTITLYPAVSGDDGHWFTAGTFQRDGGAITIGSMEVTNYFDKSFIRFPLAAMPWSLIKSAVITFKANTATNHTTCNAQILCNDADNAVAPANSSGADALALTSEVVNWDAISAWTNTSLYDTPDISPIIQEVVNRKNWKKNNALMVIIRDNGSSNDAYRAAGAFDAGATYKPKLVITFQPYKKK